MTSYAVRPAEVADAPAIARVHLQAWQEAYRGIIPDSYLDRRPGVDERTATWAQGLRDLDPRRTVLVGTADGEVVGIACSGPTRDEPAEPAAELWMINVLAAHHGTGLAQLLMERALAPYPDEPVSLWVLRDNGRARAFYEKLGFRPDGRTKELEPTGTPEVRMVRAAGQPGGAAAR